MAARRGRRVARALAHQRVLPGGHQGARRRQAVRRAVRRRRVRRAGRHAELRRSAAARSSRPRRRRTASRCSTDDGVIMDFPCSYGEGDLPRNVTRSGIHVVTEKYEDFYMSNPAAGYSNVHERFAVRISNNGEFIHANPDSIGRAGQHATSPTAASTCRPGERPAVLQQRDLRRPGRGHRYLASSCPTPTATSGTGPSPGTSGRRCRRSSAADRRRTSRAPRRDADRRADAVGYADRRRVELGRRPGAVERPLTPLA